ncbi:MAG: elongation factor G [Bacillales bacterium]|nr:elongation factor G [Bacillales bacterium]
MEYYKEHIKTIALIGAMGTGKTSLAESIAYVSGIIQKKGEIEKGSTISDFTAEEVNHHYSINSSLIPVFYKNDKINFIDLPGSNEFVTDLYNTLPILSGAILVIDSTRGIDAQTKSYYRMLKEHKIPTIILLSKIDKENVDFDKLLEDLKEKLGASVVPFMYPEGGKNNFNGFAYVLNKKGYKVEGDKTAEGEVDADVKEKVSTLYDKIVEEAAAQDEGLMEKFFEGEELSVEEIASGLKAGLLSESLVPVIVANSLLNTGVKELLDIVVSLFPSMSDTKPMESNTEGLEYDEKKPFAGYVFKTIVDPFIGTISFVIIVNGSLKVGQEMIVLGKTEKVNQSFILTGKNQNSYDIAYAGDIVCIAKLQSLATGLTLTDKQSSVEIKKVAMPTPTIFKAIIPKNKQDEDKLSGALQRLALEDLSFEIVRNKETKQQLIGGQGSVHVDTLLEKMKNMFKVEVTTEKQKIVYREAIRSTAEAEGRYVKQSGGAGYYGIVVMRFEPCTEDSYFSEEIFGGSVPKNYFPPIEKGFFEALENGPLAGFPVINVHAVLTDGKYHPVDSNELAFKNAAKVAFKNACEKIKKIILEPIMHVNIKISDEYLGDILGDINKRRGRVLGMNKVGDYQIVECEVPEAEIISYNIDLKAMTQGDGTFTREFIRYEEVPQNVADKVIEAAKLEQSQE